MLVAGASSVVALGIGLLIGAFAINTGDGNEFAYQAKMKKVLKNTYSCSKLYFR